jgi:plastocyanin domain-containing protein
MNIDEMLVIAAGLAAIGWINWYFFFAERRTAVAVGAADGSQEVTIGVRGGYDPAVVQLRAGAPVRLVFDRQETSGCSEEVVIPAFGIRKYLPAFEKTVVELTPTTPGTYEFTCGMSMLRGTLTVAEKES